MHRWICKKPVRNHTHNRTYNEAGGATGKAVMVTDERVGTGMELERIEEKGGTGEIDVIILDFF